MAPRASVIIPAFNLATYLPAAIDSALAQDPPGGPVEVIVVDDGSTDKTPEVLAAYAERVRVIRQPNGGLVSAVDTGLNVASGEYIALLDADDEWPRDRLLRHTSILDANPNVGLVHGDMEIIDAHGTTVQPSFFTCARIEPTDGRVLGRLVAANFVSGGASTVRSSLLPALHPISPDAAYPDWWMAACVASVADIVHDRGISNRYRFHGANMGLGAGPEEMPAVHRRELPWRRWMMWNLIQDPTVTLEDLARVLQTWGIALRAAASTEPAGSRSLIPVDAEQASALVQRLDRSTPDEGLAKALLCAFSKNPFDGAVAVDLEVALSRGGLPPEIPPPLISLETRSSVTIASLDEILRNPALLSAFGEEARRDSDGTLVVLFSPGVDLSRLVELVDRVGLAQDERCDIVAFPEPTTTPARALLTARASARLSELPASEPYGSLPLHGAVERAAFRAGKPHCAASPPGGLRQRRHRRDAHGASGRVARRCRACGRGPGGNCPGPERT